MCFDTAMCDKQLFILLKEHKLSILNSLFFRTDLPGDVGQFFCIPGVNQRENTLQTTQPVQQK